MCVSILIYLSFSLLFPKTNSGVKIKARLISSEGSNVYQELEEENWQLEIPKINLLAEISEGTDVDTLNQYIAHFEETAKENGNIGLAAHNRGYKVNYFERLKELEKGDSVFYTYNR